MKYFKTALPVAKIREELQLLATDDSEDVCVVQIRHKKSIVITTSETVSNHLLQNTNYKKIDLSPTDISVIKIIHQVTSVSGNQKLFNTEM